MAHVPWDESSIPSPGFPETQSEILAAAAAGDWERFFGAYLEPCWREIVITCRSRQIPMSDAGDFIQELALRLMRRPELRGELSNAVAVGANLAGRFLSNEEQGLATGRFRSFLKGVIANLFREYFRQRAKSAQALDSKLDLAIQDSVSKSLDRHWILGCLDDAATQMWEESRNATTKADRRLFELLYQTLVVGRSIQELAAELNLDRSTVNQQVAAARERFVRILEIRTGVTDREELRRMLAAEPHRLIESVEIVYRRCCASKEP